MSNRTKWFEDARFGMFIHWGLYSIPARGEWVRSDEKMSDEEYHKYTKLFNPIHFDAIQWAKIAKRSGMKYAVLTAKHHDGFCLFDSKYTNFKVTNTPFGRDIVREFLEAFRAEGIKVGIYYSLLDWDHPDYPHYKDAYHPMRDNEDYKEYKFDNYISYMHAQIEELCTNYGKLDIMWFDFSYGKLRGEAWKAAELVKMVRAHQPDVVMDTRLEVGGEGMGSIATESPTIYSGDFVSAEQIIPPKGMCNLKGEPLPWEACITLNNHWGFHRYDYEYKSAKTIIHKLVECVSKGGNLLINVGPDALGEIPEKSKKILFEVGEWLDKNGKSIYKCSRCDLEKPEFGRITADNDTYYFHLIDQPIGPVPIKGIKKEDIEEIYFLASGAELPYVSGWVTLNFPEYLFVHFAPMPFDTVKVPDELDTVIAVKLKNQDKRRTQNA